jgi:hypothetical protein
MIAALQFLTTGILAEMLARTYFEAAGRNAYTIRDEEVVRERTWYQLN